LHLAKAFLYLIQFHLIICDFKNHNKASSLGLGPKKRWGWSGTPLQPHRFFFGVGLQVREKSNRPLGKTA
jgi:hypothetical protein